MRTTPTCSLLFLSQLGKILRKLNAVNEYKTTHYLGDEDSEGEQSRILEI